jgi:hypothetical protein
MKSAYVITDNLETEACLGRILPPELLREIEIALAGTLMFYKHRPVALVLDPETTEAKAIQEKHDLISLILFPKSAETTYKIFLCPKTQNLTDRDNPIVHDLIQFLSAYIQQPV